MKKTKNQKGFIPIVVALGVSFMLLFALYGGAMGILQLFAHNFLGADTGFSSGDCGGSTGAVTCPDSNTARLPSDSAAIKRINKNMEFYKQIADEVNIPWEVIAGLQYREGGNDTTHTKSWANGFGICDNRNGTYDGFAAKHGHPCTTYLDDAVGAMDHLQGKVGGRLRKDVWDEDLIKKAMLGYNGNGRGKYKAQAIRLGFEKTYDGSPYVMSNFDARRKGTMHIFKHDGGGFGCCDHRDGAFTAAALIHSGKFGPDGKITALGGCTANAGAAQTTACASPDLSPGAGTSGPALPGEFYPPHGDKMNTIKSYNSTPHVGRGHGPFPTSGFGLINGFRFDNGNDPAIDYNVKNGSKTPVYAAFDGKVTKATQMHNSSYGHGAGVMWIVSTDGTDGAIYAHVTFVEGIRRGREVKKGEMIAVAAPHCGHGVEQCVQFKGSEHLHFQFYKDRNSLSKQELIAAFPKK